MGLAHDTATGDGRELARILGDYRTGRPGPTVVVLGGVHGNEPAGTVAARHVLAELEARRPPACGRLVAVTGNRAALARGQRFVDRDLNRRWFEHGVAALRRRDPAADGVEDREQRELVEVIDRIVSESDRPVVFVDLHSASSQGPPFACMADTLDNRRIALALPLPVILGLEEVIDGSLLGYLSDLGHCGVAVEGGPHAGKETVTRHVAAIWLVLVATGLLAEDALEELPAQRARLRQASRALPRFLEVRHRHAVAPGDGFVMEPGHVSFQPVAARQVVATDSHGPVVVPESGRILLPRYQGQGEDGFFVVREVRPAWLRLSGWLRRCGLDRLVTLLPGVRRHPERPDDLVVDAPAPPARVTDVMHLLGYRRREPEGASLVFSRRRPRNRPRRA